MTEVPFIPRGDRPVYCSSCYNKVRGRRPSTLQNSPSASPMAKDPEALAQIARLLADERFASPPSQTRTAIDTHFERLLEGIVAEAAASDDVSDRDRRSEFPGTRRVS